MVVVLGSDSGRDAEGSEGVRMAGGLYTPRPRNSEYALVVCLSCSCPSECWGELPTRGVGAGGTVDGVVFVEVTTIVWWLLGMWSERYALVQMIWDYKDVVAEGWGGEVETTSRDGFYMSSRTVQ